MRFMDCPWTSWAVHGTCLNRKIVAYHGEMDAPWALWIVREWSMDLPWTVHVRPVDVPRVVQGRFMEPLWAVHGPYAKNDIDVGAPDMERLSRSLTTFVAPANRMPTRESEVITLQAKPHKSVDMWTRAEYHEGIHDYSLKPIALIRRTYPHTNTLSAKL